MNRRRCLTILLLAASTLVGASDAHAAGKGKGKGRPRGKPAGAYSLTVSGYCKGAGTATVSDKLSLSATVKVGNASGDLTATDLPIVDGYFKGTGTVMGVSCTIEGRLDLPDAQDDEQNDKQAITARITGTFKDANGKVGRIVAVQQKPGNNGNNGNGK